MLQSQTDKEILEGGRERERERERERANTHPHTPTSIHVHATKFTPTLLQLKIV